MGVLDDAIREHLELKRAHGADEAEVRRKEDEALGPARRSAPEGEGVGAADETVAAQPAEEALAEDAAVSGPPPVGDSFFDEADEPFAYEPAARAEAPLAGEAPPEAVYEEEPPLAAEPLPAEPEAGAPLAGEPPLEPQPPIAGDEAPLVEDAAVEEDFAYEDEPLAAEPEPGFERAPAEPDARLEPRDPAPAGGEDDVLEETPDFLQETPEHDRLWFEQKPPRDFDFDEDDR